MLHRDARGLAITAATADAAQRFDAMIEAYMGFRSDVGDLLKKTLAADPEFPLALCARGYFMLLFAVRGLVARARQAHAQAFAAAAKTGATERERRHLAALEAWCDGDVARALAHWQAILAEFPRDVLALKLANFWHFYLGDSAALRDCIAEALRGWDEAVPGYGYVLGLQAFGFEETGDYDAAERTGRQSIEINPSDPWAAHAVAHVMEMCDRPQDGIAWLTGLLPNFEVCNNFRLHVWWHRALFHIELGEHDQVIELYDRQIRRESTGEYLDICNAAALLWRLEDEGVAIGARWAELAAQSVTHIEDHMLVFADTHYAMALAAGGTPEEAERLIASAQRYAEASQETEAQVMAESGTALCKAAVAHRRGDFAGVVNLLRPVRGTLRRIGGSHAQRDLFEKMLISAAIKGSQTALVRELLTERLRRRPNNRWGQRTLSRLAG
jgi:tetratricopeptide (TPR) repeat protein